ncbi:hypothetical protein B0H14DRAFT_3084061 [Mycena olivaceomarginata]|nr:hypothetical protein B0H14DRAFT_3084061 [Mycena olivaceomarginata]
MSETRRLLEASAALSHLLRANGIPHAFYGSVLTAVLANSPQSNEIFCIVEGGQNQPHPFRRIEILPAGETGPRHLDSTTVMKLQGLPFLTISEFIRSKLKTWMIRGGDGDAQDISYVLSRYWNRVDINRIPESDMNHFVSRNTSVGPAWAAVRRKYGMYVPPARGFPSDTDSAIFVR